MKSRQIIKWIAIAIITGGYIWFSLDFGFWLTGDMHSGGPLVGPILTPILTLPLIILLFYNDRIIKNRTIKILLAFLSFIIYFILFTYLINYFFILIFKEYYLMHEYSLWISLTRWLLTISMTITTFIILNKMIKPNKHLNI